MIYYLYHKMKRITLILLTALYLLSAVGVSAEHFYCCGKLASTTLSLGDSQPPVVKVNVKAENCCKTTKQSFKVKDNHVNAGASSIGLTWVAVIAQSVPTLPEPAVQEHTDIIRYAHAPPERQQTPIYILNCTYRI